MGEWTFLHTDYEWSIRTQNNKHINRWDVTQDRHNQTLEIISQPQT